MPYLTTKDKNVQNKIIFILTIWIYYTRIVLSSKNLDSTFLNGDKMIEKLVKIGILFDFYGKLLSERQYTIIELYYMHDLSLSEIGEELNISRQGVYDTLRRAELKLYEYENVLGLVSKFNLNNNNIDRAYELANIIEKEAQLIGNENLLKRAKKLKMILKK